MDLNPTCEVRSVSGTSNAVDEADAIRVCESTCALPAVAAMAPALCPRLAYARPVGLDQHRGRIGDDVRESALPLRFWE